MRRVLAAEKISRVDAPRRLGRHCRRHDVVELRDVAAHDPDLVTQRPVGSGRGVDVHTRDVFAALYQERHETPADKAGAAKDQSRHSCSLPIAGRIACPDVIPAASRSATARSTAAEIARRRMGGYTDEVFGGARKDDEPHNDQVLVGATRASGPWRPDLRPDGSVL